MIIFYILFLCTTSFFISALYLSCYIPPDKPQPHEIDPFLCTHLLLIGNCTVNSSGYSFPSLKSIQNFTKLKEANKNLKILITLTPDNHEISKIVLDNNMMDNFVNFVVEYLIKNNLDGFDIDWEFPVWSKTAKRTDKHGFANLLQRLRRKFIDVKPSLLITLAVSAPFDITKVAYDIDALNKYVDYVQVMNYDFHDFEYYPVTGYNSPLYAEPYEFGILAKMNADYSMRYWLNLGVNKSKLVFGIPTYGKGFRLWSKYMHFTYAPAIGASVFGNDVFYQQACNLTNNGYTYFWNKAASAPYLLGGYQWLSIEDEKSVSIKANYTKNLGLGGVMIYGLHTDDFNKTCGEKTYPLVRAVKNVLLNEN